MFPGPADSYLNQESINLYSSVYNSLAGIFKNVVPVGGNKVYFIASDHELSVSFCQLAREKGIRNNYVNSDFLSDDLIRNKTDEILTNIDLTIRQNSSIFPIACFHSQSLSFSKNLNEKIPAIVLMIILFALPVLVIQRRNLIMYFSASALAGFEIIILLILQLTAGNMYQLTGLILAALMAGLALGAGINLKFLNSVPLKIKSLSLIFFYIIAALCFTLILSFKGSVGPVIILTLAIILPSFLTGHIFQELTFSDQVGHSAGLTYSADLAGSALGFILMSGLAVPAFGIRVSILSLALLIFTGLIFGTDSTK